MTSDPRGYLNRSTPTPVDSPVDIGNRRQWFIDDRLLDSVDGLRFRLNRPTRREVVLRLDRPWEGSSSWCPTVIDDGDRYRMWYRAADADWEDQHPVTAYAESRNGIDWERPTLGHHEIGGTTENNVCIADPEVRNVTVLRDPRHDVPADERYKAVGRWETGRIKGLLSPDGIDWRSIEDPLITAPSIESVVDAADTYHEAPTDHLDDWSADRAFDSPVDLLWDRRTQRFRVYTRGWFPDGYGRRIRAIRTTSSPDFTDWTPWRYITLTDESNWPTHLYTNSVFQSDRAPVDLMFPTRFLPDRRRFVDWEHDGLSDVLFLASRDGTRWTRPVDEALLRPGPDRDNWHDRSLYLASEPVRTDHAELSLYALERYRLVPHIRRLSLRVDGFVSLHGDGTGGQLLTQPIEFDGNRLELNYATSAAGDITVALCDEAGRELPGTSHADCETIVGDDVDRTVRWRGGPDIGRLANRPVRLRFQLRDADLYSFRFHRS